MYLKKKQAAACGKKSDSVSVHDAHSSFFKDIKGRKRTSSFGKIRVTSFKANIARRYVHWLKSQTLAYIYLRQLLEILLPLS